MLAYRRGLRLYLVERRLAMPLERMRDQYRAVFLYTNIIVMMTEQQYWDEIRKVIHIFDKTKDLQKFYKEASDEDILEFKKTLPLIEGLGDLCYREKRFDEAYNLHYGKALVTALTLLARFRDSVEFLQNVQRLRWKNAMANYHLEIEKWRTTQDNMSQQLNDILERGIWLCENNSSNGILLTGINPSFDGNVRESFSPVPFSNCQGRYWNPLKKMLGKFVEQGKVSYLDLFPLRVSKQQNEFDKFVRDRELKAAILRVTQREVERLRPRLIIHANSTSGFYWGTDIQHPWMGYQLSPLSLPNTMEGKGKLYRIDGLQQSGEKISNRDTTKLIGTLLLVCPYQSGGRSRIDTNKKLTEQDILRLWNEYIELNK